MIGQSQKDPLPQKRIPGQVPDHPVSDQPATVLEMDDCRLGVFAKHPVHRHSIAELQQCGLELARDFLRLWHISRRRPRPRQGGDLVLSDRQ